MASNGVAGRSWHTYDLVDLTVSRVMARQAASIGDKIFIRTTDGLAMSFADAHRATNRIANWLAGLGHGRGSHVAVMMENVPECLLCHLALAKMGAVSVPVNFTAQGRMLEHLLKASDVVALITTSDLVARVAEVAARIPALARVIVADAEPLTTDCNGLDLVRLADSATAHATEVGQDVRFSDLAFIIFTSGTTGPSKGVMFPQARAFLWDEALVSELGINETDTYFCCTPLSHAAGLFSGALMMLALGATIALPRRFSVSRFWADVSATGGTYTTLLGAMVAFLESHPETPHDAVTPMRMISTGPYPKTWREFEKRFGLKLVSSYGLSDHSVATKLPVDAPPDKRGSTGKVIDAIEMLIVDDMDLPVPPGTVGECVLRARYPWHASAGYYKQPEETAKSRKNEWFHTGDRGYLDTEGYFWWVGRAKDSIRRRGENISCFEVEETASDFPAVAQIAAYPLSADQSEDEVAVSIVTKPDVSIDPAEFIRFCMQKMPNHMVPRFVHVTNSLPRNLSERVEKYKLVAWGEANRAALWDREAQPEFSRRKA